MRSTRYQDIMRDALMFVVFAVFDVGLVFSVVAVPIAPVRAESTASVQAAQPPKSVGYVLPGGGGGTASAAGRDTSKGQLTGALANVVAGGMYMGICSSCSSGSGCWACPYVAMAISAAGSLAGASGKSGQAGSDFASFNPAFPMPTDGSDAPGATNFDPALPKPNGEPGGGPTGAGGGLPGRDSSTVARGTQNLRDQLQKVGVKVSPDGKKVTTPDGRTFDTSKSGSSVEDMVAMGLTPSEANAALAASQKFAKSSAQQFKQMSQMGDGGGGGGRAGSSVSGDSESTGRSAWQPDTRNRKPAGQTKISGLTKKFGDDMIGVSGDNIFEMVTRRYKARDQVNDFLKD